MASLTLTPSATADNPSKDSSNTCTNCGLSPAADGAENSLGVVPTPAAGLAVASPDRAGRFDMSRRQILSVSAVPSVAAMAAVFAPSQREDEDLKLWRQWNEAEVTQRAAYDRYWAAADALPEDVRPDNFDVCGGPLLLERQRAAYATVRATCTDDAMRERADAIFKPILDSMEREQQCRMKVQVSAGLPALEKAAEKLQERADRLFDQVEHMNSPSPIAVAARLHAAVRMRHPNDFCEDYPFCLIISSLRDLAAVLPEDMAAAILRDVDAQVAKDLARGIGRAAQA